MSVSTSNAFHFAQLVPRSMVTTFFLNESHLFRDHVPTPAICYTLPSVPPRPILTFLRPFLNCHFLIRSFLVHPVLNYKKNLPTLSLFPKHLLTFRTYAYFTDRVISLCIFSFICQHTHTQRKLPWVQIFHQFSISLYFYQDWDTLPCTHTKAVVPFCAVTAWKEETWTALIEHPRERARFRKLSGTSQRLLLSLNGWHSSISMHHCKYKTWTFNYNLMMDM